MRIFRRRPRLRALDEQECYARLHGVRTGEVEIVEVERYAAPPEPTPPLEPQGPTEESPALHLLFAYPRNAARLSGEELRLELLRRMSARTDHAA